jgi:hypothetical protein
MGKTPRRERTVLVALTVLVLALLFALTVHAAAMTVDSFDEGAQSVEANPVVATDGDALAVPGIFGGERDVFAQYISGPRRVNLDADLFNSNDLSFSTGSSTMGAGLVVWDGADGDAFALDTNGLGGLDLTDGGTNNGFQLLIGFADGDIDLRLTVLSDTWATEYVLPVRTNIGGAGAAFFIPFSDFTDTSGTSDFTNVGAIALDIFPLEPGVDLSIDLLQTAGQQDWGDLPDSYGTLAASDGARHSRGNVFLGALIDSEGDGVPTADAGGDDASSLADEDGVTLEPLQAWMPGNTVDLNVAVNGGDGILFGWFDWQDDGDFTDGDEMVGFGTVTAGSNTVSLTIPASYATGRDLHARFRLYESEPNSPQPTGMVDNGEVEDYYWQFSPTAISLADVGVATSSLPFATFAAMALAVVTGAGLVRGQRRRRPN